MRIDIIENTPSVLKFTIEGSNTTFSNSLRRIMINSVPCFAIDRVTFYENTTAMFDEYIAHRIGQIPILTPSKGYDESDEIVFQLESDGPTTIYSKNLKSTDKSVKVANDAIPIIKLAEGQRLKIEGKAIMGRASRSSKFQPGLVTYKMKDDGTFEFYVESFGQMEAREIASKALAIIGEELKGLYKELEK